MNRNLMWLLVGGLLTGTLGGCGDSKRNSARRLVNVGETYRGGSVETLAASENLASTPISTSRFNVYLENSGSMNGYVKGNTGFEQSIYYYLTQVESNNVADSVNLHYINSKVIPQGSDIESFIHHVEPADFQKKGGNLGSSDIAVILDTILNRQTINDISLFISDCIFSPNKKMQESEVQNYLIEQSTRIEKIFRDKLKRLNNQLAVVICQLQSDFNGNFFNRENKAQPINHKRPFYFWLMGSPAQISRLLKTVPFDCLRDKGAEVENLYVLCMPDSEIEYGIVNTGKVGSFERSKTNPKYDIFNCKHNSRGTQQGTFQFAVGVNYGGLPLDEAFLSDPANYALNTNDFDLSVKPNRVSTLNYTHLLNLSTTLSPIPAQQVEIALRNRIPAWVEEKNDPVGLDMEQDEALDKTFGLKSLVEGVCNAFGGDGSEYAKFVIRINKK